MQLIGAGLFQAWIMAFVATILLHARAHEAASVDVRIAANAVIGIVAAILLFREWRLHGRACMEDLDVTFYAVTLFMCVQMLLAPMLIAGFGRSHKLLFAGMFGLAFGALLLQAFRARRLRA